MFGVKNKKKKKDNVQKIPWDLRVKHYAKWPFKLAAVSLMLLIVSRFVPVAANLYADYLYYYVAQVLSFFIGLIPFAFTEWILCVAVIALIVFLAHFIVYLIIKRGSLKRKVVKNHMHGLGCVICVIFSVFVFTCGINYGRESFATYIGLDVEASSATNLSELCRYLIEQTNQAKELCEKDENSLFVYDASFREIATKANDAYMMVTDKYECLDGQFGKAKPVVMSKYMSYGEIVGLYFPFIFEANVNQDVPVLNRPSDICHELAHMRGFMKEDEANFISFVTCIYSENKEFVYSGYFSAMIYATNALKSEDPIAYDNVMMELSDGVRADVEAERAYWAEFEKNDTAVAVAEITETTNDVYLKGNGVSSGVKNYSEMVDMLLAWYKEEIVAAENAIVTDVTQTDETTKSSDKKEKKNDEATTDVEK